MLVPVETCQGTPGARREIDNLENRGKSGKLELIGSSRPGKISRESGKKNEKRHTVHPRSRLGVSFLIHQMIRERGEIILPENLCKIGAWALQGFPLFPTASISHGVTTPLLQTLKPSLGRCITQCACFFVIPADDGNLFVRIAFAYV